MTAVGRSGAGAGARVGLVLVLVLVARGMEISLPACAVAEPVVRVRVCDGEVRVASGRYLKCWHGDRGKIRFALFLGTFFSGLTSVTTDE